jgi:hypothetical protein
VLVGELVPPALHVLTKLGTSEVVWEQVVGVERVDEGGAGLGPRFRIECDGGSSLEGSFEEPWLPIRSAGGVLAVPCRHVVGYSVAAPPGRED